MVEGNGADERDRGWLAVRDEGSGGEGGGGTWWRVWVPLE